MFEKKHIKKRHSTPCRALNREKPRRFSAVLQPALHHACVSLLFRARRYMHAKDVLARAKRLEKEEKERREREGRESGDARGKEKADKRRRMKLAHEREVREAAATCPVSTDFLTPSQRSCKTSRDLELSSGFHL